MTAVSDNFNRADSTNLGASWAELVGNWEIVSNKIQCNDDGGATGYYARYETDVGSSDMFSQAVTSSTQVNAGSNTGVAARMRSAANTSYQMTTRHAGDTIGNWRVSAGVETQLNFQTGANAISTTIASGDTIRLEVVGSLLRSKIQGALVGLTVDTNITDGQRAGLNGYNGVGTDVLEADDFAGGTLAADGGLLAPYVVGVSAQITGVGTSLTPTVPAVVAAGDLVVAHCTSRDAAQTMANPGSEGWSAGPSPTQTGLEDAVFSKVWGLGGQTDDTTPTFTIGSGTAGWGVTVTVYRNPTHATAPWTSVASAIVASGSQANASSATVTAPSVNHDGTHRTVVRLGSSADDNALNTPSTGALAYGAAAYDSTDGNDFAQAAWLREDITVTTNTGTSTVTETLVGNDVNNGITLVLAIPPVSTDLTVAAASQAQTAESPTLTQDHTLAVADAAQAQTADGVVLTQVHSLVVADATHSQTADSAAITVTSDLVVQDAAQEQSADALALTQQHELAVQAATQGQTADAPSLTQVHELVADGATHGQTADGVTVTVDAIDLAVQDATHDQTADSFALTQEHSLAAADAAQGQTAESLALAQAHALAVSDASQAQTSDTPALTQEHQLAAADATHEQTAGNVTLVVGGIDLEVQNADQAQTSASPDLTQQHALVVDDSAQAQSADSLALTQTHVLAVGAATQAQSADGLVLTQAHDLVVQAATQAQSADDIVIAVSEEITLNVQDAFHGHRVDNVVLRPFGQLVGTYTEPVPGAHRESRPGGYAEPVGATYREQSA